MANTQTTAVIERLLEDDYVHEQLAAAGDGLRGAYRRARHLPARKAVQDKTLYDRVRQTATGVTEAARRAVGKPKPKPPRRRRSLLLLIALAAGAVVIWAAKTRSAAQHCADVGGPATSAASGSQAPAGPTSRTGQ
jgi:hypothetical protein